MFGGGFWSGIGEDHLSREREPPPRPTTLEFPDYIPRLEHRRLDQDLSYRIRDKICRCRGFTDFDDQFMNSLNIDFAKDVPLSQFVPQDQFPSRPYLYDDDLESMLDEIGLDNGVAFREVLRLPPLAGREKPRIAHARNLFGSLEDMARYWDTTDDDYYFVPTDRGTSSTVAADRTIQAANDVAMRTTPNGAANVSQAVPEPSTNQTQKEGMKEVYKGYRLSHGESMSPGTRIALTRNLLKMVMHKFQCRDHEPMPGPREKLMFRGVKIQSIQYQFCVARIPSDRDSARARLIEGPVMAVHAREELRFKQKNKLQTPEKTSFVGEQFDLLREIGCMLILAKQRARESLFCKDKDPGAAKWWVSQPRWGGGATRWGQFAFEVFEEDDPSWNSAERDLQEQKRQREEAEMLKKSELDARVATVDAKQIEVEDLIAPSERASHVAFSSTVISPRAKPGSSSPDKSRVPTVNIDLLPRKKKLRSMERPPGDQDPALMRDGRRLMYTPAFKRKWYHDWAKLRPNTPSIDTKVIPRKIGVASPNSGFDEVYLLSSVNHHVTLTKLRVHADYLEWLDSGKPVDDSSPSDSNSHAQRRDVLQVQRGPWFDMLDVYARREFLTALWRLMSYINRDEVPSVEYEKMEEKRKNQLQVDTEA